MTEKEINGEIVDEGQAIEKYRQPKTDLQLVIDGDKSPEEIVASIQSAVKLRRQIALAALASTSAEDWYNHNGKPWLAVGGCWKVISDLGILVTDLQTTWETVEDDRGKYKRCKIMGNVSRPGWFDNPIPEMGTGSTRDFLWRNMMLEDINLSDVEKKALANFLHRGSLGLFGLRDLDWKDLKPYKITPDNCKGTIDFGGKKSSGGSKKPQVKYPTQKEIGDLIVHLKGKDKDACRAYFKEISGHDWEKFGEIPKEELNEIKMKLEIESKKADSKKKTNKKRTKKEIISEAKELLEKFSGESDEETNQSLFRDITKVDWTIFSDDKIEEMEKTLGKLRETINSMEKKND